MKSSIFSARFYIQEKPLWMMDEIFREDAGRTERKEQQSERSWILSFRTAPDPRALDNRYRRFYARWVAEAAPDVQDLITRRQK